MWYQELTVNFKCHRAEKSHDASSNSHADKPSQEDLAGVQGVTIFDDRKPMAQPLNPYTIQGAMGGNQDMTNAIASSSQELIAKHASELSAERMYVESASCVVL